MISALASVPTTLAINLVWAVGLAYDWSFVPSAESRGQWWGMVRYGQMKGVEQC